MFFRLPEGLLFLLTRPLRDVTGDRLKKDQRTRISTHTPLAGRDESQITGTASSYAFLLTRPLRDVTGYHGLFQLYHGFLLTRPLRDVTHI